MGAVVQESDREAPVACTLDRQSYFERLEVISDLNRDALLHRAREGNVLQLTYQIQPGVESRVRSLVALEQECCPFFTFEIEVSGAIRVTVTAPDAAIPLLDEVFSGSESSHGAKAPCGCSSC